MWYNSGVTTTLRAQFDGKVLVPLEPVDLPTDKVLDVHISPSVGNPIGSAARLLEAMRQPPHLSKEDVAELERAIEEGKLPVRYQSVFGEEE
jgi:hypothetical protein